LINSLNTNVVQNSRNKTTNCHFLPQTGSSAPEKHGGVGNCGNVSKYFSFCAGADASSLTLGAGGTVGGLLFIDGTATVGLGDGGKLIIL
jgi:hypothetical protein